MPEYLVIFVDAGNCEIASYKVRAGSFHEAHTKAFGKFQKRFKTSEIYRVQVELF